MPTRTWLTDPGHGGEPREAEAMVDTGWAYTMPPSGFLGGVLGEAVDVVAHA